MLEIKKLLQVHTDTGDTFNNINIPYEDMYNMMNDSSIKPAAFIEITDRTGHKGAIKKCHIISFCEQVEG